MGKAALLAIAAFAVLGTVYAMSTTRSTQEARESVSEHQYETLMRSAALVGHDRAELKLTECFEDFTTCDTNSFEGVHDGTRYKAQLAAGGGASSMLGIDFSPLASTQAAIVSIAYRDGEPAYRFKTTYVRKTKTVGSSVSAAREAGLFSDEYVQLKGNVEGLVAEGDESDELNASVHSNGNVDMNGNVYVEGFVTAAGTISETGNTTVEPNYNPTGDDPTRDGVEPVDFPDPSEFDIDEYIADLGGADRTDTDLEITGNENFDDLGGTREDPYVWHVENELKVTGNIDFDGYVVFVVDNDVHISGNIELGEEQGDGPVESTTAFFTAGDLEMAWNGNFDFYGEVYAVGNVVFDGSGNLNLVGSIAVGGPLRLTGNATFTHRKASPAFSPDEDVPAMHITAHSEW